MAVYCRQCSIIQKVEQANVSSRLQHITLFSSNCFLRHLAFPPGPIDTFSGRYGKPMCAPPSILCHTVSFIELSLTFLSKPLLHLLYGWQTFRGHNRWHFVDKRGDISWTLLATFRGQKCPRNVLFLGDFSWTFFGWHFVDIFWVNL